MAGEDKRYTTWIQGLPCRKCHERPCTAHHPTQHRHTGHDARRAHDRFTIPLCNAPNGCHMQLHRLSGPFKGWTRERLQAWENEQIAMLRAQFRPGEESDAF